LPFQLHHKIEKKKKKKKKKKKTFKNLLNGPFIVFCCLIGSLQKELYVCKPLA
jgi:hypothetical protein